MKPIIMLLVAVSVTACYPHKSNINHFETCTHKYHPNDFVRYAGEKFMVEQPSGLGIFEAINDNCSYVYIHNDKWGLLQIEEGKLKPW